MANPLGTAVPLKSVPAARAISSVKFFEPGRTGDSKLPIREVYASAKNAKDKQAHSLNDEDPRGIWIDEKVLVPYSNILWVEYE